MKKFFEKHDLVKISLIMILITIMLSLGINQGYFNAGELSVGDFNSFGMFDVVTYGLLGMYYFTVLVTFLFVVGAFYQFLSKLEAYQNLTDKLAKKVKGKEIIFSLIVSFVFAALASILNEYMVLIAFMPFIITICSKAKMDKISSFVMTFGSMLVGILGSTISQKVVGMNVDFLQLEFKDNLLEKIVIFALSFVIYSVFNVLYLSKRKSNKIKNEINVDKVYGSKCETIWTIILVNLFVSFFALMAVKNPVMMIFYLIFIICIYITLLIANIYIFKKAGMPGWAVIVPFYNIYVFTKIAGLKWFYVILSCIPVVSIYANIKMFICIAKKFGKTTTYGVGMALLPYVYFIKLAFDDSKYNSKSNKKTETIVKEKVSILCEDLFENKIENTNNSGITSLIIVGIISIITIILAYLPWVKVFEIDFFANLLKKTNEIQIFGVNIYSSLLGNVQAFGDWDLFGVQVVMILAMLVLAICYKKGLTDIIDSFAEGFKKTGKLVAMLLLAYVILEFAVMYPVIPTIIGNILGKSFNVFTTAISALITSLFTSEYQYAINIVYSYASSVYASDLKVFAIIFQAIYGLVSFFAPSSAMLLVGLSYLNIPYKDWMKYIWKFLVAMLVVIIVVALIIA